MIKMKVKYDKNNSISYLGNEGENQTKAKQKPNNSYRESYLRIVELRVKEGRQPHMIERDFLISKKTDKGLNRGERYKLALVSLGCDKNRVDSEIMLGLLQNKYQMPEDPMVADIIIVNAC